MSTLSSNGETARGRREWIFPAVVFLFVLVAQLVLVRVAGTDIPFQDQWGIEGSWLYPTWIEGRLRVADLLQPFNEHRIVWTHVLNLSLFVVNGQWDPLVQLVAIAGLRAACAAGVGWLFLVGRPRRDQVWISAGVALAFLPLLAWHNVLWGIESHTYFVIGLSLLTLALLDGAARTRGETFAGLIAGGAALLAMGPGALAPVALLGLAAVRVAESRRVDRAVWLQAWPALLLAGLACFLRATVPEHALLYPTTGSQFFLAAGRVLAWPHVGQPLAAIPMNLPLLLIVAGRCFRFRTASRGEDFVVLVGGWSAAIGLATAWVRGGSDELAVGVPSRYVDFLVLLPLANAWCVVILGRELTVRWRASGRLVGAAWALFLLVGWLGLSGETLRGIILPRARDREAPVRLLVGFQATGDNSIFAGQPRLLVPHPNLDAVRAVLNDSRMRGRLPPSLQPERPMGPLSRGARWLLGR